MKGLLVLISLIVAVCGEAPYPASGWRPSGPSFQLPQRGQTQPQIPQYYPGVDPRNPSPAVETEYGTPEYDVTVQGIPTQEQQPIFQVSPLNGPQNSGPAFNSDIKSLDQRLNQLQYQQQQERYRQLERQRQLDAQVKFNSNVLPYPQSPRQFASRTTPAPTQATTTQIPEERTTEQTTEQSPNQGEKLDDESTLAQQKGKTSVEVSRQNLQEYPGELFLSSLAQLQLQPQFVPLQQVQSSLYLQPAQQQSQKQIAGYNAQTHFAALPSVLAQQQAQRVQAQPGFQNPALLVQQPLAQYQPMAAYQPAQPAQQYQPQYQQPIVLQPQQVQQSQFALAPEVQQPVAQYQPFPQYQATPVVLQPQAVNQPGQLQPNPDAERVQPEQSSQYPQPTVQYQPALQPGVPQFQGVPMFLQQQPINQQDQYQPNPDAEKVQSQQEQYPQQFPPQLYQQPILVPQALNQDPAYQYYQNQLQQQMFQAQGALQSGLDVNQQGNDIDQAEEQDDEDEQKDNGSATAVATAFGARTRPRVFAEYGVPLPVPRQQASPAATESPVEDSTDDSPTVAQAVAVAGGTRKSAKLRQRSRRLRPVFTLDRSGHLVLAQDQ